MEENEKLKNMAKQLEDRDAEIEKLKAELDSIKNKQKTRSSKPRGLAHYAHMTKEEKDVELEADIKRLRELLAKEQDMNDSGKAGDC